MKAAIVLEIPTPYRDPLLDRIAALDAFDMHVLYCASTDPWRDWSGARGRVEGEVLPGLRFGGRSGGLNWKLNPKVRSRLTELAPDVVIVGGYAHPTMQMAMLWSKRNGVPYVIISETTDLTPRSRWRTVVKTPVVKAAVRNAGALLPTGSDSKDYLVGWGGDPNRMFFFPNAPDIDRISKEVAEMRATAAPHDPSSPTFSYIGRLVVQKNVEVLIRAFARVEKRLPQARLLIAGGGPLRVSLVGLASDLSITNVEFTGSLDPSEVVDAYADSDVFVLPSYDEPWGVVVQEAMAARLPVIVSDRVGCARDLVIEDTTGYHFAHDDAAALADRMLLLADPDVRSRMGAAGAALVRTWDYELCVSSFRAAMELARGN